MIRFISSLTGTTMSKEHFTHDNQNNNLMVPFFGGKITQNLSENATQTILENRRY